MHPTRRRTATVASIITIAALMPITPAGAELIQVVDAHRSISAWVGVHDWDISQNVGDTDSTDATSGPFVSEIAATLDDYYFNPIGDGIGELESYIGCDQIEIRMTTHGQTHGAPVVEMDAGGEGDCTITFELTEPAEIMFDATADGEGGYTWGYAVLRENGVSPAISYVSYTEAQSDQDAFSQILDTGAYTLTACTQSWAYSEYGDSVGAGGSVNVSLNAYALPDLDRNGMVDVDDLIMTIVDWGCDDDGLECPGDANRSGVVNVDDLLAVLLGWGGCGD